MYQVCGWDREGRRLSWEARVEKVGFEVFPERCDKGTVSYLEENTTSSFVMAATSSAGVGALATPPWCVLSMLCHTTHIKTNVSGILWPLLDCA